MTILLTGASGFIGQRLLERLSTDAHEDVICLSRSPVNPSVAVIRGNYDRFEDLRLLDEFSISTVVHLAAVTGGCSEEDGLSVNLLGTRRLYRYLLDRGATRFIGASSIAAVGCLDNEFLPQQLPIPDDHICLAKDAYGLSKFMLEQLTYYLQRNHTDATFINLRLGSVVSDDSWTPPVVTTATKLTIPFVRLSHIYASDVVEAIVHAIHAPLQAGAYTWNMVGPESSCSIPTIAMLSAILGERAGQYDLSYYEQPGHSYKPIFSMENVQRELGFAPGKSTRAQ
ncbi:NAD(P)-dependent oxidoreductase [Paenibacillus sp. WQ 127069]|uniref:NAD(P)-dependent oxidoreductase n=1 Tax=Paenibacillus baimaensis TaxID=2982185 RepID=A0ABT2UN45_9BACL|nr:NAD(P)-dependent oxidoreductase [Paenibacillus sp. WQ 127069]MCU6795997.1 NAD(P)-dependent oxidoreductase [Paenibacillus sp. WQ 127069]